MCVVDLRRCGGGIAVCFGVVCKNRVFMFCMCSRSGVSLMYV